MGTVIETYTEPCKAGIVDLIVDIQRNEFGLPITADDQPDLKKIPEFYLHGAGNFWVARHGEKVIGTLALLDIGDRRVALRKMFVAAPWRGGNSGVAGSLLQTALNWAGEKGVAEVYLGTTDRFLAAHRFYEKNGFAEIPKESLPPSFPVMSVDTKFYRLRL